MAISVVATVKSTTNGGVATITAANASFTLGTTPTTGDFVLVVVKSTRSAGARTVSSIAGLGATWSAVYAGTRIFYWLGTGATASGGITVTLSAAGDAQATAYLLRGLTATGVIGVTVNSTATTRVGTAQTGALGLIAVAAATSIAGTLTYPSAQTPAASWTALGNVALGAETIGDAYQIPSSSVSMSTSSSSTSSTNLEITSILLGAFPVVGPPPTLDASTPAPVFDDTITQTDLVTASFTPPAGSIVVVKVMSADAGQNHTSVTATGGLTLTRWIYIGSSGSSVRSGLHTGVGTGSPTVVTVTFTGNNMPRCLVVEVWAGAQLAATPAFHSVITSGAPLDSINTVAAGSVVTWMCGDWKATDGASRAYRFPATELRYHFASGQYTFYSANQPATVVGSQPYGLTAPINLDYSLASIELQPIPTSGPTLLLELGFTEGSGTTAADTSGSGRNGTLIGSSWAPGENNFGVRQTTATRASNDRVNVSRVGLEPVTAFTLMAWVKTSVVTGYGYDPIIEKPISGTGQSYALWAAFANNPQPCATVTTSITGAVHQPALTNIHDGLWHHVAATYDGALLKVYVDGTQETQTSATGTIVYDTNDLGIGGSPYWAPEYVDGTIDEVRIFDTALTSTQINTYKNTPIGGVVTAISGTGALPV